MRLALMRLALMRLALMRLALMRLALMRLALMRAGCAYRHLYWPQMRLRVTRGALVTASHAGSGECPRMISRCSVPASGPGHPGTASRGYPGSPAPDRAALLSQQAALRRPGCLRPSSEPGTRRARASGRGVLRPAVSRARPRPAANPHPQPGPVPGPRPVPDAALGRVPRLDR